MEHYIAYHSAKTMGYELEPSVELRFLSRKLGILKKAVGNIVWVVQGIPNGKKTAFSLCGVYVADRVDVKDPSSNLYVISGQRVKEFAPPVPLNDFDWFPSLLKSQSNFSLGFNRVSDGAVVQSLITLKANEDQKAVPSDLPDIDLLAAETEGAISLVSHLRRERSRALVDAKKKATLKATGRLCCEVCGFDFLAEYGALGEGFCEIHHLAPLSVSATAVTTTLNDLAVVCSNCHRIIHLAAPMPSVAELSNTVSSRRTQNRA